MVCKWKLCSLELLRTANASCLNALDLGTVNEHTQLMQHSCLLYDVVKDQGVHFDVSGSSDLPYADVCDCDSMEGRPGWWKE